MSFLGICIKKDEVKGQELSPLLLSFSRSHEREKREGIYTPLSWQFLI
jgi:hypothetical protein